MQPLLRRLAAALPTACLLSFFTLAASCGADTAGANGAAGDAHLRQADASTTPGFGSDAAGKAGIAGASDSRSAQLADFVATESPNATWPTFAEIWGADDAKATLCAFVDAINGRPRVAPRGLRPAKGILLVGPPGVGKTMLAKATAKAADANFVAVTGADLRLGAAGLSGRELLLAVFAAARQAAPAIVFIDEIDALVAGDDAYAKLLGAQLDGFAPSDGIYLLAATNDARRLPPSLLRAGRIDHVVDIELPNPAARAAILGQTPIAIDHAEALDLNQVSALTTGMSGADLVNLSNLAALRAADDNRDKVGLADYDEAIDDLLIGPVRPASAQRQDELRRTAYHEAGHALLASLLQGPGVVRKVSIVARGPVDGYTVFATGDAGGGTNADFFQRMVAVAFGGRAAEEVVFGSFGAGGISDLDKATAIVRYMLAVQGMGKQTGPMALHTLAGASLWTSPHAESTKARLDDEARQLLVRQAELASKLLQTFRTTLDALAEALLAEQTLTGAAVDALAEQGVAERSGEVAQAG